MNDTIKKTSDVESQKVTISKNTTEFTNKDVIVDVGLPCKNSYIEGIDGNQIVFTKNDIQNIRINIRGEYKIEVNNIDKSYQY